MPVETGEDCGEDHQDSAALSAELHPQGSHPPVARTAHTSTLRPWVQKCEMHVLHCMCIVAAIFHVHFWKLRLPYSFLLSLGG